MFYQVARDAIDYAKTFSSVRYNNQTVAARFVFNGIQIIATSLSHDYDVCMQYDLKNKIQRLELGHKD